MKCFENGPQEEGHDAGEACLFLLSKLSKQFELSAPVYMMPMLRAIGVRLCKTCLLSSAMLPWHALVQAGVLLMQRLEQELLQLGALGLSAPRCSSRPALSIAGPLARSRVHKSRLAYYVPVIEEDEGGQQSPLVHRPWHTDLAALALVWGGG